MESGRPLLLDNGLGVFTWIFWCAGRGEPHASPLPLAFGFSPCKFTRKQWKEQQGDPAFNGCADGLCLLFRFPAVGPG